VSWGAAGSPGAAATPDRLAARRSTALLGNSLAGSEDLLEQTKLDLGAGGDQDVADVEHALRVRRRVSAAVALPQGDVERARLLADVQLANRLPALAGLGCDLDLLEAQIVARRRGD